MGVRLGAAVLMCAALGCTSIVQRAGITWLYREAKLPDELALLDVSYVGDEAAGPNLDKQRLDFFRPAAAPDAPAWPVLVFVHGGGWTFGDRAQVTGGADIYRNVGRYFASHGVGTAVISYRLQPGARWQQQVEDVGQAVGWAREYAARHGGDPEAVFLAGHSAGAHLSARYALDPAYWAAVPIGGGPVCGLLLVSGAAYDLADEETYALGASRAFFEERFGDPDRDGGAGDAADTALRLASVVPLVDADSPPALVINAAGEQARFKRQGDVLVRAYEAAGAPVAQILVPGEDHERMALAISRDDKTAGPAMRSFMARRRCGATPAG